jgi:iron(III) transport system substrate-binding protein
MSDRSLFPVRWPGWLPLMAAGALFVAGACRPRSDQEVVAYVALDREFAEPVLDDFTRETGIQVVSKFDFESTKTVGLVNELLREKNHPRCDLFWNNEILHTLRLEREGLLDVYPCPAAQSFPTDVRSADGRWFGFAARARVIVVNTDLVPEADRPRTIAALADPRWRGRVGIAKPLFGTTATHAAVLFARLGNENAREFFHQVKSNARVMAGNKQVAVAVGRGQLAWGVTDTDDAFLEIDQGRPLALVFPDQAAGEPGCLFIPNSLCVLKNGPHPAAARRLVDYLLRPEVEERLAQGESGQFPLNPQVRAQPRQVGDEPVRRMEVDFRAAAAAWDEAAAWLRKEFE